MSGLRDAGLRLPCRRPRSRRWSCARPSARLARSGQTPSTLARTLGPSLSAPCERPCAAVQPQLHCEWRVMLSRRTDLHKVVCHPNKPVFTRLPRSACEKRSAVESLSCPGVSSCLRVHCFLGLLMPCCVSVSAVSSEQAQAHAAGAYSVVAVRIVDMHLAWPRCMQPA